VRDGLWKLDGEAEVGRGAVRPSLPGFALVRTVEAGVDFDTVEAVCASLEVCAGFGKVWSVLLRQRPSSGADSSGARRRD